MSEGAWDYVMGNDSKIEGSSGITTLYNDFFTNDSKWSKYYDLYANGTDSNTTFDKRILGDATREVEPFIKTSNKLYGSWYNIYVSFPTSALPWVGRGGANDTDPNRVAIFAFGTQSGVVRPTYSFRLTLSP